MTTMKSNRRGSGPLNRARPGGEPPRERTRRARILAPILAGLLLAAGAAGAVAQGTCDESAGTLGIQGMRCEGCTFTMSREGITEARFRTEPQVLAVVRGFAEGDRLRAGDRIVAIDGALITTRDGSDRLVGLQTGQSVALRVRRNGRLEDLHMVAGSACEMRRQLREDEVEVERLDDRAVPWSVRETYLPPAPPADAPLPPRPVDPALPPALGPTGYLGFGIRCSECGLRNGVFFFGAPPEITSVDDDGPAAAAGLRPGDVILAVDDQDITGRGARRFGEIEPGQSVALTVRRDDANRTVTIEAGERPEPLPAIERPAPVAAPRAPMPAGRGISDEIRFTGSLGDVTVEVRGGPVTVERDESTGELVIRTGQNVIRLVRPPGG